MHKDRKSNKVKLNKLRNSRQGRHKKNGNFELSLLQSKPNHPPASPLVSNSQKQLNSSIQLPNTKKNTQINKFYCVFTCLKDYVLNGSKSKKWQFLE